MYYGKIIIIIVIAQRLWKLSQANYSRYFYDIHCCDCDWAKPRDGDLVTIQFCVYLLPISLMCCRHCQCQQSVIRTERITLQCKSWERWLSVTDGHAGESGRLTKESVITEPVHAARKRIPTFQHRQTYPRALKMQDMKLEDNVSRREMTDLDTIRTVGTYGTIIIRTIHRHPNSM